MTMIGDDEIRPVPLIQLIGDQRATNHNYKGGVLVLTESGSRYFLDLELELLRRIRGTEQPDDPEVAYPSRLRRDGETLRLLRVLQLELSKPMIVDLEPLGDPGMVAFTRRTTTFVVEIRQLPSPPQPDEGT